MIGLLRLLNLPLLLHSSIHSHPHSLSRCTLQPPRSRSDLVIISSNRLLKSIPAASALWGNRLVAVIPGRVFTSST